MKISYGRQTIDKKDLDAVSRVLLSDFLTQGPTVAKFEKNIARFVGAKYAVAFSSGTAALHGACVAAGISENDEVITTPMTFAASANCVLYCGGTPVFADIQKNMPLIDPSEIEKKISKKSKAIIPVDYSGIPADYDEINKIAKKNNLIVISDAAHSLGGAYKNEKVGTLTDMTVFSFHPVKLITTGEGGMVVTNNSTYFDILTSFRTHGMVKDEKLLDKKEIGPWYHEMQTLGYNYRLTDIQAALGLSQISRARTFHSKRSNIAIWYMEQLKNTGGISIVPVPADRVSGWHLFPILLDKKLIPHKKQIVKMLHAKGVMVQVHYIPVHVHPYYRSRVKSEQRVIKNAELFYARELSLPLYPLLTKEEMRYVVKTLKETIKSHC